VTKRDKKRQTGSESRHRHHALALEIAKGATITDAAKSCNYSRQHASKLSRQRGFQRMVKRLREQITAQVVGRLTGLGAQAADTLQRLLGETIPPQVRHAAAKTVLQMMLAGREAVEVDELLRRTERVIQETSDENSDAST